MIDPDTTEEIHHPSWDGNTSPIDFKCEIEDFHYSGWKCFYNPYNPNGDGEEFFWADPHGTSENAEIPLLKLVYIMPGIQAGEGVIADQTISTYTVPSQVIDPMGLEPPRPLIQGDLVTFRVPIPTRISRANGHQFIPPFQEPFYPISINIENHPMRRKFRPRPPTNIQIDFVILYPITWEANLLPQPTEPQPTEPQPTEPQPTELQPTELQPNSWNDEIFKKLSDPNVALPALGTVLVLFLIFWKTSRKYRQSRKSLKQTSRKKFKKSRKSNGRQRKLARCS